MISKQEISDLAREFSLDVNTIEKDYVLGWLLAGIEHHHDLFEKWIFKGGTCLKKCYFETYRFSEDLDYTLIDKNQIDDKFLSLCFMDIATWLYDAVGIEIPKETIQFKIKCNQKTGKRSVEGKVGYIGPMQRRRDPVRIKLDLTADELVVMPHDLREVHHPYSDNPNDGIKSYCYSFSEVFAEKLRALGERARPRDLYDVIHLFRHANQIDNAEILEALQKKCDFKDIPVPTMNYLKAHPKRNELETEWKNMLAHQLPLLPTMENFWEELPNMFDWLHGRINKMQLELPLIPFEAEDIDLTWHPPGMIQPWQTIIPFELVRYAAANHLCVEIDYQRKDLIKCLIEPYDIKRTKDGNLLLVALENPTNEKMVFLVNDIKNVEITQIQFTPQYHIGLTPFSRSTKRDKDEKKIKA